MKGDWREISGVALAAQGGVHASLELRVPAARLPCLLRRGFTGRAHPLLSCVAYPARRTSRGSPHRASDIALRCVSAAVWVVRKDAPGSFCEGLFKEAPRSLGRVAAATKRVV